MTRFTDEQAEAIARRDGELILDANAGSGKTSVLVERFVRTVLDDGVPVGGLLAITFTEKAAGELRDRIRRRFRELGADGEARQAESAAISTIHGFCARVLRAGALAAGIDPAFTVLDEQEAGELKAEAFTEALEALAERDAGAALLAAYPEAMLAEAVRAVHGRLRSAGARMPRLPDPGRGPDPAAARGALRDAAAAAARELGAVADPGVTVGRALERLVECGNGALHDPAAPDGLPWPEALDALVLPGGNAAALKSETCETYGAALAEFRRACEHGWGRPVVAALDALLAGFSETYEAAKARRSAVDFEDLELRTLELLRGDAGLCARLRDRFAGVMIDELQDTNPVQMELIELVADGGSFFTVGDALQSIYGFRHADVGLFESRRTRLAAAGRHATLRMNFRSRAEILEAINIAFEAEFAAAFKPLVPGRDEPPDGEARVELLLAEKGAEWQTGGAQDELVAPWRLAEARALARRVRELVDGGTAPREIVVLTRATTDLRAYERALEAADVPTYVIGGRGYWGHPQVLDLACHLRALANPRDELALFTVLVSPLVGLSDDAVVLLASAARAAGRDPWALLTDSEAAITGLGDADRAALARWAEWFAAERRAAGRVAVEELIERALTWSGYDLAMLRMAGGRRRLANVRKLMRLAREHERRAGADLHGFAAMLRERGDAITGDTRESEAPVEGEALDAVRLMTIHRAKGLEFDTVCVADLGRAPRAPAELLRVSRSGRIGLRLARPGTGRRIPALDYDRLGRQLAEAEAAEERRLFFVAMTRARERLILSGAVHFERPQTGRTGGPIAWIGPAFVPDLHARLAGEITPGTVVARERDGRRAAVALTAVRPGEEPEPAASLAPAGGGRATTPAGATGGTDGADAVKPVESPALPASTAPVTGTLSYSSLARHRRCGYRYLLEGVLRLPADTAAAGAEPAARAPGAAGWNAAERGTVVHAVLARLELRAPAVPDYAAVAAVAALAGVRPPTARDAEAVAGMTEAFAGSAVRGRLAAARRVRRETPFTFALGSGGALVTGALDVLADEPGNTLVVDFKTDALAGADPVAAAVAGYGLQRLVYAVAALSAGAAAVEVVHLFLERPDAPAAVRYTAADDLERLRAELAAAARPLLAGEYPVSAEPRRSLCAGCPGEGGLCSWPLPVTRRESAATLF